MRKLSELLKSHTLRYCLLVLCIFLLGSLQAVGETRPNIVWIVLDDLGPELGCYGDQNVSTPAMDALAERGIRYTNCFSTSPVCSASRSAFVTGVSQIAIGAHHHRTRNMKPLPESVQTVMEQFQSAGYFVCDLNPPGVKRKVKRDYNFEYDQKLFDGNDRSQRKSGQPFFAQIQIHEPHRPFHRNTQTEREQNVSLSARYPDHPLVRSDHADYLESVEVADRHVAAILSRLKEEGLLETTWIFLFGDHGRPHVWGKQWLYDEGLRVPLIVSGPGVRNENAVDERLVSLIDLAPTSLLLAGIEPHAKTEGKNFLDEEAARKYVFAARDRCGEAEDRIRAVRSQRYKYIKNFHPEIPYSQWSSYKRLSYPVTTLLEVLSHQKKLTGPAALMMQPSKPPEELYDLNNDPNELVNLAKKAEYSGVLKSHRAELVKWINETNDAGAIAEGDEEYQTQIDVEKRAWYDKTMKRRKLSPDSTPEEILRWWEHAR